MERVTTAAVRDWFAKAYGDDSARVVRSVRRTSGGLFEIACGHRKCWLRLGGILRQSESEVEVEGRVATDLAAAGVQIVRPAPRSDGAFAGSIAVSGEQVPAIAYEEAQGEQVEAPTPAQATRLGEAVARLHRSRVNAEELRVVEPIGKTAECVTAAARWLDARDEHWLRTTVEKHSAALAQFFSSARETICHGDLRLANTCFLETSPTLFDLEFLGMGPPAYDCACMWRRRVVENGFSVPKDWKYFKQGYEDTNPVGEEHWRLVPVLAVLRAAWTMSLPVLPGATWGDEWARDPDYWRAHLRMVRWFAEIAENGESA